MTDPKDDPEFSEEHVEDLEAPASEQEGVAGGIICRMTNYEGAAEGEIS
jgi:hypothetical protein